MAEGYEPQPLDNTLNNVVDILKVGHDFSITNNILVDALNNSPIGRTVRFFIGSGSPYTGTVPSGSSLGYGIFIVIPRYNARHVIGFNDGLYTNVYNGSAWTGWKKISSTNA